MLDKFVRINLTKDAECMYESNLIDNCFFSHRSKAEKMEQTIMELRDQGVTARSILMQDKSI